MIRQCRRVEKEGKHGPGAEDPSVSRGITRVKTPRCAVGMQFAREFTFPSSWDRSYLD